MNKRLKKCRVSLDFLTDLLKPHERPFSYTSTFPQNAKVVAVRPNEWNMPWFEILVESEQFQEVLEGDVIPEFTPEYRLLNPEGG